jgi:hypothetical protein
MACLLLILYSQSWRRVSAVDFCGSAVDYGQKDNLTMTMTMLQPSPVLRLDVEVPASLI